MDELRILICGDRNWDNYNRVKEIIEALVEKTKAQKITIIEGEAKGADTQGRMVAEAKGYHIDAYPARWDIYGRGAGPIRNKQQMREGDPHVVVGFHENIEESKGTLDMLKQAVLDNRPTILVTNDRISWFGNKTPAYEL